MVFVAALLNLARDRMWGGGSATYEEKSGPDQRVLAGHQGGHFTYFTLMEAREA